jgi:hypothetical protein
MSQINRYVALYKSTLSHKKARIGNGRVEDESAPGILGVAIASNGRRNVAPLRAVTMKLSEGG